MYKVMRGFKQVSPLFKYKISAWLWVQFIKVKYRMFNMYYCITKEIENE